MLIVFFYLWLLPEWLLPLCEEELPLWLDELPERVLLPLWLEELPEWLLPEWLPLLYPFERLLFDEPLWLLDEPLWLFDEPECE